MKPTNPANPTNPAQALHGVTLEAMLNQLHGYYGWQQLAVRINIKCFTSDPSIPSSLKFLRKTPWARTKVEQLYLEMLQIDIKTER